MSILRRFQADERGGVVILAGLLLPAVVALTGIGFTYSTANRNRTNMQTALDAAVREISPLFKQCNRCGNWVCEPVCWNKKAGLCEACAPDLDEEIGVNWIFGVRESVVEDLAGFEKGPF